MILFLRDNNNNTILDLEVYVKKEDDRSFVEVSSVIDIKNYSILLLDTLEKDRVELVNTFDELSELRGWLWENYFMVKENKPEEYDNVVKELKSILTTVANKYNLNLIQD